MKKKILCALIALLLMLSSCALAEDAVKITFWHSMSDEAGVLLKGYVDAFNQTVGAEKGIEVEAVFQGKYSDAVTKMNGVLNTARYGELPDVMNLDATGKLSYYYSDAAYTLDDALADDPSYDISAILPAALANWSFSGTRLGMPFATSTTLLYYNKTLFDRYALAAPDTFEGIIAAAEALRGEDITVYAAIPNTPTIANWLGQLGSDLVDHKNGTEAAATQLDCIDNGALMTFLSAWKGMYQSGALVSTDGSSDAFVTGRLALYTTSSSNITSVLNKVGDGFSVGVAFYPRVNAEASVGATVSGSCLCMFDKGDDEKKKAAWEFVKYMTSAEVQADFAVGTGYAPSNLGAMEMDVYKALVEGKPQYGVALEQLALTPESMRSVTVGPSIDFYYAIQDCVSAMLKEDWTAEETVEIMADELNGLIYQYNLANQ